MIVSCASPFLPRPSPFPLSVRLQSDVWEADLWDRQRLPPSLPGQPVCMFPDARTCVFCHGVHGRRRPHDAHTCRRLFWATCCVSSALSCMYTYTYLQELLGHGNHAMKLPAHSFAADVNVYGSLKQFLSQQSVCHFHALQLCVVGSFVAELLWVVKASTLQ